MENASTDVLAFCRIFLYIMPIGIKVLDFLSEVRYHIFISIKVTVF